MTLRLDIVRHAQARPTSDLGDAGRELTEDGVAAVRALSEVLRADGWRPEIAFTSPLTRARQTMSLLLDPLGGTPLVRTLRELLPDGSPEDLFAAVTGRLSDERHVLLVGHQPLLGAIVAFLTGERPSIAPASFLSIELADAFRAGTGRIVVRR